MYNEVGFDTASVSAAVCTFQCLAGTRVLMECRIAVPRNHNCDPG